MHFDNFRAMNSEILLAAEGVDAVHGFEVVRRFIEASERRFTRFSQTSELALINQGAGKWMNVSIEMFELLEVALGCHHATECLFEPAILPDLEKAGYTKSMDDLRISGAQDFLDNYSPLGRSSFSNVELRQSDLSIFMPKEMRIDLGGIAKGWIAEQATHKLANFSPSCGVNAGGDMFLIGSPAGSDNWEISLEDPRHPDRDLMALLVEDGAVATSSVVKRVWQQGTAQKHHLIDPRTGEPAVTPWLSVTVLAPGAAMAEVFAKSILIAGPDYANVLVEKNPQVYFLAVDGNSQIWVPENGECVALKNNI